MLHFSPLLPGAGQLQTAGGTAVVEPGVATATITSFAPSLAISDHKSLIPGVSTVTITAFAPSVNIGVNVTPGVSTATITSFAPSLAITDHRVITPGVATATITSFPPSLTISDHKSVTPEVSTVTITAFAPSVDIAPIGTISLTPGVAHVTITSYPPTVEAISTQVWLNPWGAGTWREIWARPPMVFQWQAHIELPIILTGTMTYIPASKKARAIRPLITESEREQMVQGLVAVWRHMEAQVAKRKADEAERARIQQQNEDDEEAIALAMALLL